MATVVSINPAFTVAARADALMLALHSAGDERIFRDPVTGRTKYGTPQACAEDEIWFSSSTASALSPRGLAAAQSLWQAIVQGRSSPEDSCADIRRRLLGHFGIEGAEAVLAGSGTEAALLATSLFCNISGPAPLTAFIIGQSETGRGIAAAAGGRHFLHHAAFAEVTQGAPLAGLAETDIAVEAIDIRDPSGALRKPADIEAELAQKVAAARHAGRAVVVHSLDMSKTGQSAPDLAALAGLRAQDPDHIFVLADCCQLRCSAERIKTALSEGFLVTLTGSKFAGGPSFCGALLVAPALVARFHSASLPAGLAAYSTQDDWPAALRTPLGLAFLASANLGLALRWQAALAEIDRFLSIPADLRNRLMLGFYGEVVRRAVQTPGLEILAPCAASADIFGHTILAIAMRHPDGSHFSMAQTLAVQAALREGCAGQRFHLGQPVALGEAAYLRACASAPILNRLAEAIDGGETLPQAFAPIAAQIEALFAAWTKAMQSAAS